MLLLCIVGVVLGRVQTHQRANGLASPVDTVIRTACAPVSSFWAGIVDGTSGFVNGLVNASGLTEENARLRSEVLAARLYNERLEGLQREIEGLRQLQGFRELPGKTKIPADVIGFFPYENRLTLNVGQRNGVRPGMAVVASEGMVGTVQTVEAGRCQVLLLSSASVTVGAIAVDRNPPPAGLLRGENSRTLSLTFQDPKAPVQVGDTIVSGGYSEFVPKGLPIGQVIQIDENVEFGTRRALVYPFVEVGDTREVYVLK